MIERLHHGVVLVLRGDNGPGVKFRGRIMQRDVSGVIGHHQEPWLIHDMKTPDGIVGGIDCGIGRRGVFLERPILIGNALRPRVVVGDVLDAAGEEAEAMEDGISMSAGLQRALGGKLHTGRSRNDQVALDLRLYLRDVLITVKQGVIRLQKAFLAQGRKHLNIIIPGYTHLQRAQPVLLAHHWLAYVEMLERDKGRIQDASTRVNVMPLGSGALAGTNYPLDRSYTAKLLKFPAITTNSLDAVSDRDFVVGLIRCDSN